jgi:hypothetical protein
MNKIMISIITVKSISTVEIRHNSDYVALSSKWNYEKEKFPFATIIKAIFRLIKLKLNNKKR